MKRVPRYTISYVVAEHDPRVASNEIREETWHYLRNKLDMRLSVQLSIRYRFTGRHPWSPT